MLNDDNAGYYRFTGRQRIEKAIHTLEGLVTGGAADGTFSPAEIKILNGWLYDHREFSEKHPFNEVIPILGNALLDRKIDEEEKADLLYLCKKITTEDDYFDVVSADMQRLQGIMAGISFDGDVSLEELVSLQTWMEEHDHLRQCWPYDELEALIVTVLKDGEIDDREHQELLAFFADFANTTGHRTVSLPDVESVTVKGVCAVCPDISFRERVFCFTGKSAKLTRKELVDIVERLGGTFSERVTLDIDYLIIGADGNPCWAYSCYGRKVEAAVHHRKRGHNMLIVHENDFWDGVQDAK